MLHQIAFNEVKLSKTVNSQAIGAGEAKSEHKFLHLIRGMVECYPTKKAICYAWLITKAVFQECGATRDASIRYN